MTLKLYKVFWNRLELFKNVIDTFGSYWNILNMHIWYLRAPITVISLNNFKVTFRALVYVVRIQNHENKNIYYLARYYYTSARVAISNTVTKLTIYFLYHKNSKVQGENSAEDSFFFFFFFLAFEKKFFNPTHVGGVWGIV